jgi:tungstate transport system ATP-binding protein
MSFIELRDIKQTREERDILKGVNFRMERGEILALIGPTGAGKTTLLRIIDLLDTPAGGKVFFDGVDVTESEKLRLQARRRMAFVLQKPVVFNSSVYENVACALRWRGLGKRQVQEKVDGILEMVELKDYRNRNARTLSGGETQRVAIARAIAVDPEVLVLDEPSANLDPVSERKVEDIVADIIKRETITVVMATHDMLQGQRLADRVGVLIDGTIAQAGSVGDIFSKPRSREVAEFIGMENILDGTIKACEGELAVINVNGKIIEAVSDCDIGEKVSACMRPEDITIALSRISSSARNSLEAKVTWTVTNGPFCRIELDCGFPLVALVTQRSATEMGLKKGTKIYATFKAVSIHVIKRN